jgi:c-di-AMP phosphodiesterase-like protein
MQSLDEFINKSQCLLDFYEVIRTFKEFEKTYYEKVPVVELMEVDNYN